MITIQIEFDVEAKIDINEEWLNIACASVLEEQGHEDAAITLVFSNDESLSSLKKEYFSKDQYTDVIAFNLEEKGEALEGEVYISLERVRVNATEYGADFDTELRRVIIHGCLHLTGLDDQTAEEKENMTCLEDSYLKKFSESVLA